MTLTISFAFNDAVLLCADRRRSTALSHTFLSNNPKIHTFGRNAALTVEGLAPITDTVLAKLRASVASDVGLDVLTELVRDFGHTVYHDMINTIAPHPYDYRRAGFTVAGFDAQGRPGIRLIGLQDGTCVPYGAGQMVSAGATEVGESATTDANDVLRNPGPVFGDELGHYVISRGALRLPSQVGLPVDVVLLSRSGTFTRIMPEAELTYVQPMFQLVPSGLGFSHSPLVLAGEGDLPPRAVMLRGRPL